MSISTFDVFCNELHGNWYPFWVAVYYVIPSALPSSLVLTILWEVYCFIFCAVVFFCANDLSMFSSLTRSVCFYRIVSIRYLHRINDWGVVKDHLIKILGGGWTIESINVPSWCDALCTKLRRFIFGIKIVKETRFDFIALFVMSLSASSFCLKVTKIEFAQNLNDLNQGANHAIDLLKAIKECPTETVLGCHLTVAQIATIWLICVRSSNAFSAFYTLRSGEERWNVSRYGTEEESEK